MDTSSRFSLLRTAKPISFENKRNISYVLKRKLVTDCKKRQSNPNIHTTNKKEEEEGELCRHMLRSTLQAYQVFKFQKPYVHKENVSIQSVHHLFTYCENLKLSPDLHHITLSCIFSLWRANTIQSSQVNAANTKTTTKKDRRRFSSISKH